MVAASAALITFAGCGEKKQQSAEPQPAQQAGEGVPAGHPAVDQTATDISKAQHANIKTQKTVSISEEVRKKWKEVKIEITDASSGSKQAVTIQVGSQVMLKPGVHLKVEAFVPDYAISDNKVESRSNEPKNPAVLVELIENDKSAARGWIFKDFPEFNSYGDKRFSLKLVAPGAEKAAKK